MSDVQGVDVQTIGVRQVVTMPRARVVIRVAGAAIVLHGTGIVDETTEALWQRYLDLAAGAVHRGGCVVVDLAEVVSVSSTGMAMFERADRTCRETNRLFRLAALAPAARPSAGIEAPALSMYPSVADALADFNSSVTTIEVTPTASDNRKPAIHPLYTKDVLGI